MAWRHFYFCFFCHWSLASYFVVSFVVHANAVDSGIMSSLCCVLSMSDIGYEDCVHVNSQCAERSCDHQCPLAEKNNGHNELALFCSGRETTQTCQYGGLCVTGKRKKSQIFFCLIFCQRRYADNNHSGRFSHFVDYLTLLNIFDTLFQNIHRFQKQHIYTIKTCLSNIKYRIISETH